jgi:hypothetical protein
VKELAVQKGWILASFFEDCANPSDCEIVGGCIVHRYTGDLINELPFNNRRHKLIANGLAGVRSWEFFEGEELLF